jgi:hypothetical protein
MTEPRISFAPGVDAEDAIARALTVLRSEGVVVLDDLADPALIAQAKVEIEANYPDYDRVDPVRNYAPYPGRHTMPMTVEGALADRAIFIPKPIERIASTLLGADFKMDSLGLLVSLPGAGEQKAHPDGILFPEAAINHILPTFALAFAMPLITMDEVSGTTAFWRRSHKSPVKGDTYDLAPVVPPGSAILWDCKTIHAGLANRGTRPRPVIYSIFARHWWVDQHPPLARKYEKLLLARNVYDALNPRLKRRMSRAKLVGGDQLVPAYAVGVEMEETC